MAATQTPSPQRWRTVALAPPLVPLPVVPSSRSGETFLLRGLLAMERLLRIETCSSPVLPLSLSRYDESCCGLEGSWCSMLRSLGHALADSPATSALHRPLHLVPIPTLGVCSSATEDGLAPGGHPGDALPAVLGGRGRSPTFGHRNECARKKAASSGSPSESSELG